MLIKLATQSMQLHKQRYYDDKKEESGEGRTNAMTQLIHSLEQHDFHVFMQAKIDASKNKLIGAEALIRFIDAEFGVVPPGKFIPMLEKNNLIRYIDLFVFEEVCKTLQKWSLQGLDCPVISLNFSRKTLLEDHLIEMMEETVSKYKVDKRLIEIEITEDLADVGKTIVYQMVKHIRNAGFSVSLDDFGTSYSNLSILSELEFDTLKIDRSLIHSLESEEKNRIILRNVIEMCKELQVNIIAEGVESEHQRDILQELGCIFIQGYLYSKPIPIHEFEGRFMQEACV